MSDINADVYMWIDLETTGLSNVHDAILEVAAALTHEDDLLPYAVFQQVVSTPPLGWRPMEPEVREMHKANGLLAECQAAREAAPCTVYDMWLKLARWLESHTTKGDRIIIAGSGVSHFDHRWITDAIDLGRFTPDREFAYWTYDVGVVRRWLQHCGVNIDVPNTGRAHRAYDDVMHAIQQGRAFRSAVRSAHLDEVYS